MTRMFSHKLYTVCLILAMANTIFQMFALAYEWGNGKDIFEYINFWIWITSIMLVIMFYYFWKWTK